MPVLTATDRTNVRRTFVRPRYEGASARPWYPRDRRSRSGAMCNGREKDHRKSRATLITRTVRFAFIMLAAGTSCDRGGNGVAPEVRAPGLPAAADLLAQDIGLPAS